MTRVKKSILLPVDVPKTCRMSGKQCKFYQMLCSVESDLYLHCLLDITLFTLTRGPSEPEISHLG